jgi:hypothetical protein
MNTPATVTNVLSLLSLLTGCWRHSLKRAQTDLETLAPSPRLVVGRIIATDPAQRFAFIEVNTDAPGPALSSDTELIARTSELTETAHLLTSRYLRGRTFAAKIIRGEPSPGNEVVWQAP